MCSREQSSRPENLSRKSRKLGVSGPIAANCAQQLADFDRIGKRRMMAHAARTLERPAQIAGWVALCSACCDGVTEYLTAYCRRRLATMSEPCFDPTQCG